LFATNVTNKKYWAAAVSASLPSIGGGPVILGVPRMFGARVRFSFGD